MLNFLLALLAAVRAISTDILHFPARVLVTAAGRLSGQPITTRL